MGYDLNLEKGCNEPVNEAKEMYRLAERIFPFCRSITGDGVRETLSAIDDFLGECADIKIYEVPSGTEVFDWKVPKEWRIKEAYIETEDRNRIIDFRNCNLHVVGYSAPVDRWVGLDELKKYIYTQPDQPEVVPYVTSYYKERYGFCMSEEQKNSLQPGRYHMVIDSELFEGSLTYGEVLLAGRSAEEVFITTYICHPSMANNECSGPALLAELIKYVTGLKDRRYTYRFLFAPETIGAITYLAAGDNLRHLKEHVAAGFNISCVGDDRDYSIIESRYADTLADRVLSNVLDYSDGIRGRYSRYSYLHRGSDERQYGAPGVGLPLVTFCRTKFCEYPEYHTSADDLSVVSEEGFQGSFHVMKQVIDLLENNFCYQNTVTGEPQLGRRGLYPDVSQKGTKGDAGVLQDFLAYADGQNDLVSIGSLIRQPAGKVLETADRLRKAGLIKVTGG